MSASLVGKLLESFDKLDRCIELTRSALTERGEVPAEVLSRVEQYTAIVNKQRALAESLKEHIEKKNWPEVARHVRLINGLSAMIRDDAQDILAGSTGREKELANPEQMS